MSKRLRVGSQKATGIGRLLASCTVDARGCWNPTGARLRGYSLAQHGGKTWRGHRLSYLYLRGPLPDGLQLDHLCRNRGCVNPDHLEAVTCHENLLRGETAAARNAAKTHCPAGHEYSGTNSRGHRVCRQCANLKRRAA